MKTPAPHGLSRREFLRNASLTAAAFALRPRAWGADAPVPTPAPTKKLGIAIAGLGSYATGLLAPALRQTQLLELRGVVTRRPAVGAQWASVFGFPAKNIYNYDTMNQLADNPDIDIVYVVTPNGLHAEHVIKAAKAGKHVICEKPMANTVAECDAMLAACRAAKRTLSIGYRTHFDPYHQELIRLAQSEEFGPFTKITGNFSFIMNTEQWRMEKPLSGGGPLMDIGIYVFHTSCLAANANPIAVTARELPKTRPDFFKTVEESIEWTMEFPKGVTAAGNCSYDVNSSDFRAEASKGWIDITSPFSYTGLGGATSKGPLNYPPLNPPTQTRHMDSIAQAILDKHDSSVPGELGRRDMVIMEGIYKSAATGKRVELNFAEPVVKA